ncbi:MAG: hypothetical protein RLP12_09070, partial [Ekhidna sp.]
MKYLHHEATVFLLITYIFAAYLRDIWPLSTGSHTCFLKANEYLLVKLISLPGLLCFSMIDSQF